MNVWLFKTEPSTFGLDDLRAAPGATTSWDGVRNYQARNFLRDRIALGDRGILYHSSCAVPAAVALLEVVRAGYPETPSLPSAPSRRPASAPEPERPVWYAVDVHLLLPFPHPVTRPAMREHPDLIHSRLLQRGNRLSVLPLSAKEAQTILDLADVDPAAIRDATK